MKIIQHYKLFFCRFTPADQSPYEELESQTLIDKIYDISNQKFTSNKQLINHQSAMVKEVSKKGKHHYHFCFVIKLSINSLRDQLKKRLDAYGNKSISCKEYECSQTSFDLSCAYMLKGDETVTINYYNIEQEIPFQILGNQDLIKLWIQHPTKSSKESEMDKKRKKFKFYKGLVCKYVEKTHKKSKLKHDTKHSIDTILSWYSYLEIRKLAFRAITLYNLNEGVAGNFAAIGEMSNWLALSIIHNQKIDPTEHIDQIYEKKMEKYQDKIQIE